MKKFGFNIFKYNKLQGFFLIKNTGLNKHFSPHVEKIWINKLKKTYNFQLKLYILLQREYTLCCLDEGEMFKNTSLFYMILLKIFGLPIIINI